jgi:hypothetical protein
MTPKCVTNAHLQSHRLLYHMVGRQVVEIPVSSLSLVMVRVQTCTSQQSRPLLGNPLSVMGSAMDLGLAPRDMQDMEQGSAQLDLALDLALDLVLDLPLALGLVMGLGLDLVPE